MIGIASGEGDCHPSEATSLTNTDILVNMPGSNSPPGASGLPSASGLPRRIDPDNFTASDGVKVGQCSVRNKKWVNYLEKGYEKKSEGD